MQTDILDHLIFLYGDEAARATLPRLRELMERFRQEIPREQTERWNRDLSERDAILITYGDQVREPGKSPLRSLSEFLGERVPGTVSGVHVLPFYPYSSDDGFSVIDYCRVDPALGDWPDVVEMGKRFDLMFDAVLNHVSAESEWFQKFLQNDPDCRDFFISFEEEPEVGGVVRPRALPLLTRFETASGSKLVWTTFSADQVDLNVRNPHVLLALTGVLLFYVAKGARFIRLDAIAYLWKEIGSTCIHLPQTHRVVQLFRSILDEVAPGVMLITETNVPHVDNISYFGDGTNEAQMVYNFALPPLVLNAFQTGSARTLADWAATLRSLSEKNTFFNFLASHDGIGVNPVRGLLPEKEIDALVERTQAHGGLISYKSNPDGSQSPYELNITFFDALSDPADRGESLDLQVGRFMSAQAIMLALAGIPGVYFHSLFGSRNDRAGAEQSGISRRINREKLSRPELEHELSQAGSVRQRVFDRFVKLLQVRQAHRAFHPMGRQRVMLVADNVFAVERISPDEQERVLCLQSVSSTPVPVQLDPPEAGQFWRDLLRDGRVLGKNSAELVLAPYEIVWARAENSGRSS